MGREEICLIKIKKKKNQIKMDQKQKLNKKPYLPI